MQLNSKVILYRVATGFAASMAELKLENNILTLISEGQPISDLVVRDIDRVIFSIPINELEGYSHWRRSDKLYLYVNGKRFALDFPHTEKIAKSIWNDFNNNAAANTEIDSWLDTFFDLNVKKKINFKAVLFRGGAALLIIASFLISKLAFN